MALYRFKRSPSSPTGKPYNPDRRHRANFARAATVSSFGRHAWALDQADFVDRLPNQAPRRINVQIALWAW